MTIPLDWLTCPVSVEDVEARLSTEGASDIWLKQWRAFLSHVGPDDEIWEYFAIEQSGLAKADDWDLSNMREGYAIVRDGEVVQTISSPL
jgi:hypothetical protein